MHITNHNFNRTTFSTDRSIPVIRRMDSWVCENKTEQLLIVREIVAITRNTVTYNAINL